MGSDDYARAIIAEGQRRGVSERGIVIALATALVESNMLMYANRADPQSMKLPHDAVGSDANSVGLFQQRSPWWDKSTTSTLTGTACRMDPACSAGMFYDALQKLPYDDPTKSPGSFAQKVQQSAFPTRYDARMGDAQKLYDRLAQVVDSGPRPDFNEYPRWSDNCNDRGGTEVDLWLIHTQEGGGGDDAADDLASFLISSSGGPNPVSYHYTISQASDGGVTVVDVVDTDQAAWAVGDANERSINLCFAGSSIHWTEQQWMAQSKAIDVAAYLAVQDANKYGFDPAVIIPPYAKDPPGVSDHRYVTSHLGWGSHTDVGPNFPWEYFRGQILSWQQATQTGTAPSEELPDHPVVPYDPSQNAELEILVQVRGRYGMLGGQTLVEALAEIRDKLLGTTDRHADDGGFTGW